MKFVNAVVLGASALGLAIGSAYAAGTSTSKKDQPVMGKAGKATRSNDSEFAKLDRNHDGYISKSEAKRDRKLAKDFDSFDLNHDGKLNRAEYLAAAAKEDTGSLANRVMGKDKSSSTGSSSHSSSDSTSKTTK